MLLKKFVLDNYKQHTHRELEIQGNLVGVIGRNGTGKSNLLGGLQFGFGGEQPGSKREDLLCWGAAEGSVNLELEHNGVAGHIRRNLHNTKAEFKFGDEKYSGITKVSDGIVDHLGLDKDLLKQAVFVRQAEIDSVLFEDPRARELSFQKLCGLGAAAKVHQRLGEILSSISNPPDYDSQIAESRQKHGEMHSRLKELEKSHTLALEKRNTVASQEELQAQLSTQEVMRGTLRKIGEVRETAQRSDRRIAECNTALKLLHIPEGDISQLDQRIQDINSYIYNAQQYEQAVEKWKAAGTALVTLTENKPAAGEPPYTPEQIREMKEREADLTRQRDEAIGNAKFYGSLIEALRGKLEEGMECPVCGGRLTDPSRLEKLESSAKSKAEAAVVDGPKADAAAAELSRFEQQQASQLAAYEARYTSLEEQYEQHDAALKQMQKPDSDLRSLIIQLEEVKNTRNDILKKTTYRTEQETSRKNAEEILNSAKTELDELEKNLREQFQGIYDKLSNDGVNGALAYIEETMTATGAALADVRQLDQQTAQLGGMIAELGKSLDMAEKNIGKLEHKQAQQKEYREALKVLEDVRSWFHYGNGPHTLSTSVLAEMTEDVNGFLAQFAAPYSVIHDEDALGFKCIFHDGRTMPASGPLDASYLSGGEKIQLAISFRFASYCMFAGKLGLLSLDEPTVYLDDNNVGRFCSLLERIREIAQQMNLQVFIATHERAVIPFLDSVIDLNA